MYLKKTKGYYFYHLEEQNVFVAWIDVFLEREFILKKITRRKVEFDEVIVILDTIDVRMRWCVIIDGWLQWKVYSFLGGTKWTKSTLIRVT